MQIQITGQKLELTPALRDYVQGKITKLEEFFSGIQKVEVVLEARANYDDNQRQVAEIRAWLSGKKVIQAQEAGQDAYAAFDLALDEAKRQVEKHKEKLGHEKKREAQKLKIESRLKSPGLPPEL
ncbi:MAG: ribosome-associated translation inhibitor RaiA [Candidatus Margulisbacteria bacterium]|jgi:putative sigma-54 modulation protein|nr:ribosome-associated translation inhibitor RaiA [Candidatus Margulisiibacteriota bacterium]